MECDSKYDNTDPGSLVLDPDSGEYIDLDECDTDTLKDLCNSLEFGSAAYEKAFRELVERYPSGDYR